MIKISIIMPSFNQVKYIREAIDSVLNQSYENRELIVIDGGSTDGTVEVLKSYGAQITYWSSEPDRGQSDALNKGLAKADGEIVGWMNADDAYLPLAFSRLIATVEGRPNCLFYYGRNLLIDKDGRRIGRQVAFNFSLQQLLNEGFHCFTQSFFWKREACADYVFPIELSRSMDYHFFTWCGLRYGSKAFIFIKEDLGLFRCHELQKTGGNSDQLIAEYRYIESDLEMKTCFFKKPGIRYYLFRARRLYFYARFYLGLDTK